MWQGLEESVYFSSSTNPCSKANQEEYLTFIFVHSADISFTKSVLIACMTPSKHGADQVMLKDIAQRLNTGSLTVLGFELVQVQPLIPNYTGTLSQPSAHAECQSLLAHSQVFEVFREIKWCKLSWSDPGLGHSFETHLAEGHFCSQWKSVRTCWLTYKTAVLNPSTRKLALHIFSYLSCFITPHSAHRVHVKCFESGVFVLEKKCKCVVQV